VPSPKCPECGRFLKQSMVASLTDDPTPCPRCETGLVAAMFPDVVPLVVVEPAGASTEHSVRPPDLGPDDPVAVVVGSADAPPNGDRGSVRPPDLPPVAVRDEPRDVLAGWDAGMDPVGGARLHDRAPFPTDAAIVGGAGLVGALIGAMASDRHLRGATLGGVAGVAAAAVVRQVWRLDP
jgi:hypothetical protein